MGFAEGEKMKAEIISFYQKYQTAIDLLKGRL